MAVSVMREEIDPAAFGRRAAGVESLRIFKLADAQRDEALAFLAERPVHTVYMSSLLRDNGVESRLNRGTFYACRDADDCLVGVALVGHATLVETRSEAAVEAFARLARGCASAYLIRGEQEAVGTFWKYYAEAGDAPRLISREMLYELRTPLAARESVRGLRRATLAEVEQVMRVNAAMVAEECGTNPSERDPVGFRVRTARRIEQGRVWVWADGAGIVFKADVLAETPEAIYLEGVYVRAEERGKGVGSRCMAQLGRELLSRVDAVCLVVSEKAEGAQAFYRKSGYRFLGYYDTIYLQPHGGN
ncbi:MAG: GNAT family N-acetyltransferase [Acidobacteria bacterium]|nr:GNAT family N-acetyltransferase [Acidobacteriota bacterium]MCA1643400.1 GNAT family N-acetyltransferase [Acidobacteriota bacterium]